jgi:Tfp pilus assembly protein PilF
MNILGRPGSVEENGGDERVSQMHVYRRYAARAIADERWAAAEVFLDRMLEVDPRHTEAWLMKAHLFRHCKNDPEAAIECYRKVIILGGYDTANPHVRAAQDSLESLLRRLA